MKISKQYTFDAAHQLWLDDISDAENESVFGKCARLHGHTYTIEVEVAGHIMPSTGMVLNYFSLDEIVKPIVEQLDHRNLNNVFSGMLTTAENMVEILASWISTDLRHHHSGRFTTLWRVTLQETPKTKATWDSVTDEELIL